MSDDRSTRSLRQLLPPFLRGHRRQLVLLGGASLLGGLAEAAILVILARVAFAVASDSEDVSVSLGPIDGLALSIPALVSIAAALVIIRLLFQGFAARQSAATVSGVLCDVRRMMVHSYLGASWSLQSDERDGRLQELLSSYATHASSLTGSLVLATVALLNLVALLATALAVNPIATVLVAVAGALLSLIMRPLRHGVRRRSRAWADDNLAFATAVSETASLTQEVHVFGVGPAVEQRLKDFAVTARRSQNRMQLWSSFLPAVYQASALLLVIGAFGIVYAVGSTRLAALGGVVLIMLRSLSYAQNLQVANQSLHSEAPYLETLLDELERYAQATVPSGCRPIHAIDEVEFVDVSFEYRSDRAALHNVSFSVQRGQIIGIVGPSGAGKSTLVQLLLRLREPTEGTVRANGVPINEFAIDQWHERVAFVPQDAHLFSGSVRENVRFFRDGTSPDAIERAVRLAHVYDETIALPDGFETHVGEQGRRLSGGQRQRIAIARALLTEPDLLVLDEPTSALDVRSESLIRNTLGELGERTTVFVIAHRLSTLDICDRIMVLRDGNLEGFDDPSRLEATNSFYREALRLSGLR
jgi:ABC-type multidrug transport system fused ATPase/permease subunit